MPAPDDRVHIISIRGLGRAHSNRYTPPGGHMLAIFADAYCASLLLFGPH